MLEISLQKLKENLSSKFFSRAINVNFLHFLNHPLKFVFTRINTDGDPEHLLT